MNIRHATPADAVALQAIKRAVWPEEDADLAAIAVALNQPDHQTQVAVAADGTVIGFADGFLTLAADESRRWEVDLLAVHPTHQRQGTGQALVAAVTAAGRDFGAVTARALIQVENRGSQKTFAYTGYSLKPTVCHLLINTDGPDDQAPVPPGAHLVPVITFNYRGLWIEGQRAQAFGAGRAIRARHGWDVAGAVIPETAPAELRAAEAAGYANVGAYQWWVTQL